VTWFLDLSKIPDNLYAGRYNRAKLTDIGVISYEKSSKDDDNYRSHATVRFTKFTSLEVLR